jgi:predicted  nucleic acid-binding Zn-ribbon protein
VGLWKIFRRFGTQNREFRGIQNNRIHFSKFIHTAILCRGPIFKCRMCHATLGPWGWHNNGMDPMTAQEPTNAQLVAAIETTQTTVQSLAERQDKQDVTNAQLLAAIQATQTTVQGLAERQDKQDATNAQLLAAIQATLEVVQDLKTSQAQLASEVRTLQNQFATLQSQVAGLQDEVAGLHREFATLRGEVATLRGEVEWLKKNAALKSDQEKWAKRFDERLGHHISKQGKRYEQQFLPNILQEFDGVGMHFDDIDANQLFFLDGEYKPLAEVDAVLKNGKQVMLVESKPSLRKGFVNEHLERIKTLREAGFFPGMDIYGAIAVAFPTPANIPYALSQGLFVVSQRGTVPVQIEPFPEGMAPKAW